MRINSVKELFCKLCKVLYLKNNIGISAPLWKDRYTSDPYAFLKYNTEENHTTVTNKCVTNVDTYPRRAICTHKVREEREEIVGRQLGHLSLQEA